MQAITGLVGFLSHFVVLGLDISRHELPVMLRLSHGAQLRGVNRLTALSDLVR